MDLLHQLALGFGSVFQPLNLIPLVIGLVVGMIVAVLPGLTLVMGVVLALKFDTPEYFAIILFGLTSIVALGGGLIINAFISLFLGLLIATVGVDGIYGVERFTFGVPMLADGIEYLTVMVGAYGLGEVLVRLETGFQTPRLEAGGKVATQFPTLREVWGIKATLARSSVLGIIMGIIPGAGATIASFVSYGVEAQYCARRKELGSGIAEGIVAPQTASTATVAGHM